jgi:hypothetical protein
VIKNLKLDKDRKAILARKAAKYLAEAKGQKIKQSEVPKTATSSTTTQSGSTGGITGLD